MAAVTSTKPRGAVSEPAISPEELSSEVLSAIDAGVEAEHGYFVAKAKFSATIDAACIAAYAWFCPKFGRNFEGFALKYPRTITVHGAPFASAATQKLASKHRSLDWILAGRVMSHGTDTLMWENDELYPTIAEYIFSIFTTLRTRKVEWESVVSGVKQTILDCEKVSPTGEPVSAARTCKALAALGVKAKKEKVEKEKVSADDAELEKLMGMDTDILGGSAIAAIDAIALAVAEFSPASEPTVLAAYRSLIEVMATAISALKG